MSFNSTPIVQRRDWNLFIGNSDQSVGPSNVTLTFERTGSTVGVGGRALVGTTYSGFTFGADLYYLTSLPGQTGFDTIDSSPGALWVWDGETTGGPVTTTIASAVGFNAFAFDWNAAQPFTLTFLDASGDVLSDITLGSGDSGFQGWGAYPAAAGTTFSIGGTATSVEISCSSNDLFLDNLTFGLV